MASAEVYILGKKYTIKGEAPSEHMQRLARYVEEKIKEVCDKYPNITPTNALILAAFNVTDELFRNRAEQDDVARHIEKNAALLVDLFEQQ
ncbi:MAG: cell division protein ZapA [Thermodesulfovibrionales bacterium]